MGKLLQFIIVCLIVAGLFVPESSEADQKKYLVGFAQDTLANDWRAAQVKALKDGFEKYPSVKFIYSDANGRTANQIQDIEKMIEIGVDVLITSPRDSELMAPVIAKAYQKGIPVVLISRGIASDDYTTFIHPDNRKIAGRAGLYIAEKLDGKGGVLILQHIPTTTPAIQRTEGFLEAIAPYENITVVGIKVANSLRSQAILKTEEAIRQGLKFQAIYAQSDSMASGARMALKKMGLDPKTMVIVGIDFIDEARQAIKSGEQSASFTYPTGGREGVELTMKILKGLKVPREYIIDSVMVNRSNVDSVEPIF